MLKREFLRMVPIAEKRASVQKENVGKWKSNVLVRAADDAPETPGEMFPGMENIRNEPIIAFTETGKEEIKIPKQEEHETIEDLFLKRGFQIIKKNGESQRAPAVYSERSMPECVRRLACRMAENYEELRDFCHMLRSCNSGGRRKFSYAVPKKEAECVMQFAEDLRKYGVLILPERFAVSAGCPERTICGDVSDAANVIAFFNGIWLECFSFIEAEKAAKEAAERMKTDFEVLANVSVEEVETKKINELDIVIRIGSSLFWIECKCGSFHESAYLKYYRLGKRMSVVPDHMLLLAADLTDREKSEMIGYFYQYKMCSLETYRESLREMLNRAEMEETGEAFNS